MSTNEAKPPNIGRRRQTVAEEALDANALELFARIAQAGSFAQAARDLGLTRAAISRRIAAIENAVGLTLFARSTRSLGLTEAGRRLHARARAVREAAESARLALRQTRDQLDGTIRISATAGFGRHVLAPLLARFQALHPAVRYELFFTDRRVDLLREGVDIAFRVTSKPPETWVAQPVLGFEVRAYGGAGHQVYQTPQGLAMAAVLLLGQSEEPFAGQWLHADGQREDVTLQAVAWGSDLDGLIALARHGAGIVIAPDFCVEPVAALQADDEMTIGAALPLRNVLPGWRLLVGLDTVQALTLPSPAGSETARALVRFVRDALLPAR
ncbi:LysR family transcriptional regulator [Roseateles asaccharophilus]|uniref:DNA-binding transcriptional LysR family regulator n=1 Tax=Roseateles asaccharophilus TaxID=582607 RepID=A0ABU2AGB6_9BURK|nr:LysR family transcriptional regulator [Roseateles asaccharophilus]MDR7336262.1 DNA-binding transcriptional LysR family regulator [Roseateles asaccharophilus]